MSDRDHVMGIWLLPSFSHSSVQLVVREGIGRRGGEEVIWGVGGKGVGVG